MADAAPKRLVVLLSGRGSHFENLQQFLTQSSFVSAQIVAVISDQADALGLIKAQAHHIPTTVIERGAYATQPEFDAALVTSIKHHAPDWVVLAGFMRVLSQSVVSAFRGQMINVHPSLLPKYKGLHTHQKALDAGDQRHGASIHFVTEQLDGGPILSQVTLTIEPSDDAQTLAHRLLPLEHRLMQATVALLVNHDVQCFDDAIEIDRKRLEAPMLLDRDFDDRGHWLV